MKFIRKYKLPPDNLGEMFVSLVYLEVVSHVHRHVLSIFEALIKLN